MIGRSCFSTLGRLIPATAADRGDVGAPRARFRLRIGLGRDAAVVAGKFRRFTLAWAIANIYWHFCPKKEQAHPRIGDWAFSAAHKPSHHFMQL